MSDFEKIIIPLAVEDIKRKDLTEELGFIDSYTYDEDKPWDKNCILLAFDARKRSKDINEMSVRYDYSKNLKRKYIKLVNNIPYYFYVFYVPHKLKELFEGVIVLTYEQKLKVLQFWGASDYITKIVFECPVVVTSTQHDAPLEDVKKEIFDGLTIKKAIVS